MDAVIFLLITIALTIPVIIKEETSDGVEVISEVEESKDRVAKINDSYYEDLNAFSEIINALGFPKE